MATAKKAGATGRKPRMGMATGKEGKDHLLDQDGVCDVHMGFSVDTHPGMFVSWHTVEEDQHEAENLFHRTW